MTKKAGDLPDIKGGTPVSRQAMYSMIAAHGPMLIRKLIAETESKNPSIRIAALRTLINKILPDLDETSLVGKDGEELKNLINVVIQSKPVAE